MQRRDFIKGTGAIVAGMLAENALARSSDSPVALPLGRRVLSLNRNWRFNRSAAPDARKKDFDDSGFERVVIPHANTQVPWHSFDEKQYQFVSMYRRHFRLPPQPREHRVFVDFEGVMTAATVWLNGVRLGDYKGGYTPFSFDLTSNLDFQGENVLAVEVDSRERADIPPFGNQIDYLTFGGIYRDVALRIVPPTFVENIFAKPQDVLTGNPKLDVDKTITELAVGEALVSFLDERGTPGVVERAMVVPPRGQIGPITPEQRAQLMKSSLVAGVYENAVDRESAYEILKVRAGQSAAGGAQPPGQTQPWYANLPSLESLGLGSSGGHRGDTLTQAMAKSAARTIGSGVGREIVRGVLGSLLGGGSRRR